MILIIHLQVLINKALFVNVNRYELKFIQKLFYGQTTRIVVWRFSQIF